jgi:hypothetical protein
MKDVTLVTIHFVDENKSACGYLIKLDTEARNTIKIASCFDGNDYEGVMEFSLDDIVEIDDFLGTQDILWRDWYSTPEKKKRWENLVKYK